MGHDTDILQNKLICGGEDDRPRPLLAGDLIRHIEMGGIVATGDPAHIEFVRYEIWQMDNGNLAYHLGGYGWGSALGQPEDRLLCMLKRPWEWICVGRAEHRTAHDIEVAARAELFKVGHYEDYKWKWDRSEERQPNE